MPNYFLNSFHPLGERRAGAQVCAVHGIPPYVDYSIRREPDFEHPFPSITGLCRVGKLIYRTSPGDCVAYVTTKCAGGRHLIALLRIVKTADNHCAAASIYQADALRLPRNLVVPDNPPLPADQAGLSRHKLSHKAWERAYARRARRAPRVLICEHLCAPMLHMPPLVPENIFGRPFPSTRTPPAISASEFESLQQIAEAERSEE